MGTTKDPSTLFKPSDPFHKFLSTESGTFKYRDLYNFAQKFQVILQPHRRNSNQPLAIISNNSPATVFSIAACFLLKIPVLPLSKNITQNELVNILALTKPFAVFPGDDISNTDFELPVITIPIELLSNSKDEFTEEFLFDYPEIFAGYFQTSGSTGNPKIVPMKRRQVYFGAAASANNFRPSRNRYWLLCLPLNHVGGINVIYRSLLYNSAIYLVPSFDAEKIRSLLHENKDFEAASMVPTMLQLLLDHTFFRLQFRFKALLLGGGPISMALINKALTRGLPIVTSYGMTETCAQIAANPMLKPGGDYIPKKSVGQVFEPNEIEIRDENGIVLPYNESGQIWLKGPQVFDGYLDPDQNETSFDEKNWFNTGDFGHLNRKKHLFIENRRSDLIITGGENVNPVEVEAAISRFPSIKEACVVGVPDKKWGQMVVAFIVSDNKDLRGSHIKKHLKEQLEGFKIPKQFISVGYLPKTESEKVKKTELLSWYVKEFGG